VKVHAAWTGERGVERMVSICCGEQQATFLRGYAIEGVEQTRERDSRVSPAIRIASSILTAPASSFIVIGVVVLVVVTTPSRWIAVTGIFELGASCVASEPMCESSIDVLHDCDALLRKRRNQRA